MPKKVKATLEQLFERSRELYRENLKTYPGEFKKSIDFATEQAFNQYGIRQKFARLVLRFCIAKRLGLLYYQKDRRSILESMTECASILNRYGLPVGEGGLQETLRQYDICDFFDASVVKSRLGHELGIRSGQRRRTLKLQREAEKRRRVEHRVRKVQTPKQLPLIT